MRNAIGLLSLVFICFCPVAFAAPGNDKVQVETVADTSAIVPGKPFMLGFKFTIQPGWHIYWKNPGDSGLATQLKMDLPEGFTAGDVLFPVPTRLQLPGDIVNYAYENQVMLMVKITPPKDLPAGKSVAIAGKASWLVCQDTCIPGKADVSVELPVASNAITANEDLFKLWTSQLPVKEDRDDIRLMGRSMSVSNGSGSASIEIGWKKPASNVLFIPGAMKYGDIVNVKVDNSDKSIKIAFDIKNFVDSEPVTGLLVFTSAAGVKTGVEISMPYAAGGPVPPVGSN